MLCCCCRCRNAVLCSLTPRSVFAVLFLFCFFFAGLEGAARPLGPKCSAVRGSDGGNRQEPPQHGFVTHESSDCGGSRLKLKKRRWRSWKLL